MHKVRKRTKGAASLCTLMKNLLRIFGTISVRYCLYIYFALCRRAGDLLFVRTKSRQKAVSGAG